MIGSFFLGWELWQQMTLVLACSIIVVFGLGLARLWWTNRCMHKLELLDAEKRARKSDVQRCGVGSLLVNDIPFGVRAIQCGIEVDGIWISNPNTPDLSHITSSATLVGDQPASSKSKGTSGARSRRSASQDQSESAGSSSEEAFKADLLSTSRPGALPAMASFKCLAQPHRGSRRVQSIIDATPRSSLNSYIPSIHRNYQFPQRHWPPASAGDVSHRPESLLTRPISSWKDNIACDAVAETHPFRDDDCSRHIYQKKMDPNAGSAPRPQAETVGEDQGNGECYAVQSDRVRRPRRLRVSRKPRSVQPR